MSLEVELPTQLSPVELDRKLARGFFRSGPILFRASFLHPDEVLRELVHLRVKIDVETRSRSRARLLRRNRTRFRTTIRPAQVDDEHRRLYRQTRERFMGFVASELDVVAVGEYPKVFDTREVCVWDGDHLVAVSYFDIGKRAVASILGLHDPAYARHSLGIYTMLEEMAFARERGARWYYPGYVIPGLPGFDYKLRLGPTQFMDGRGRWRERVRPPTTTRAADYASECMNTMQAALSAQKIPTERRIYPAFWLGHVRASRQRFARGMWHLRCSDVRGRRFVVEHLPHEDSFIAAEVRAVQGLDAFELFEPNPAIEVHCECVALTYINLIEEHRSIEVVVQALTKFLQTAPPRGL